MLQKVGAHDDINGEHRNTTKAKEAATGTAAGTGTHHVALVVALHGSPKSVRHRCVNPSGVNGKGHQDAGEQAPSCAVCQWVQCAEKFVED